MFRILLLAAALFATGCATTGEPRSSGNYKTQDLFNAAHFQSLVTTETEADGRFLVRAEALYFYNDVYQLRHVRQGAQGFFQITVRNGYFGPLRHYNRAGSGGTSLHVDFVTATVGTCGVRMCEMNETFIITAPEAVVRRAAQTGLPVTVYARTGASMNFTLSPQYVQGFLDALDALNSVV